MRADHFKASSWSSGELSVTANAQNWCISPWTLGVPSDEEVLMAAVSCGAPRGHVSLPRALAAEEGAL
jgi:hypothetical protein